MQPDKIRLNDWQRILIGEVPGSFFVEVVIRTVAVYVILMISMRLMGKRMASQTSRNELAAMVSLAAAIGIPIEAPNAGLLPAVIIAVVVVAIGRGISIWAFNNQSFEKFSQGDMHMLVRDAVMDIKAMQSVRVTRERLFAQLRSEGITHLGKVKRLYMEAGGGFTLIQEEETKPGLSIIPEQDAEFANKQKKCEGVRVCKNCGAATANIPNAATKCLHPEWITAIE